MKRKQREKTKRRRKRKKKVQTHRGSRKHNYVYDIDLAPPMIGRLKKKKTYFPNFVSANEIPHYFIAWSNYWTQFARLKDILLLIFNSTCTTCYFYCHLLPDLTERIRNLRILSQSLNDARKYEKYERLVPTTRYKSSDDRRKKLFDNFSPKVCTVHNGEKLSIPQTVVSSWKKIIRLLIYCGLILKA